MKENNITRKNLVQSLIIGLVIGFIAGTPFGWAVHRFYAEQRMAQVLICRERNKDQPIAIVEARCGSRF